MNDGTYIFEIPLVIDNTTRRNMPFYSKKYCNESLLFDNNIVKKKRYIQIRDIENEVFSIVLSKL
jgi:alanine-alpha-ketoisovalerate/valine-pyruvate aminotransferase